MPHLVLRHSNNLSNIDFRPFFKNTRELLSQTLGVKISSCSSLVISHTQYVIGDGEPDNAIVHLDITIIKQGQKSEDLHAVSRDILELLRDYLNTLNNIQKIKSSVIIYITFTIYSFILEPQYYASLIAYNIIGGFVRHSHCDSNYVRVYKILLAG